MDETRVVGEYVRRFEVIARKAGRGRPFDAELAALVKEVHDETRERRRFARGIDLLTAVIGRLRTADARDDTDGLLVLRHAADMLEKANADLLAEAVEARAESG